MSAMGSFSYRGTTIALSIVALLANVVSAFLFQHLPDDPYHIAVSFQAYSQFASILSLAGLIGAIKRHAFAVSIFGIYLIIDATLCAIPRFLVVAVFSGVRDVACTPGSTFAFESPMPTAGVYQDGPHNTAPSGLAALLGLTPGTCQRMMYMVQVLALLWVIGTTIVQFTLALQVREYGNRLFAMRGDFDDDDAPPPLRRWRSSGSVPYPDDKSALREKT